MDGEYKNGNADLWRGTAIAAALIGLVLAVFVGIANSRLWNRITAPRRVPVSVVPMAPGKAEDPYLHAMDTPNRDPGGAAGGGTDPVSQPSAGPGDALRQALGAYRHNAKRTATVTITTSGRARIDDKGELTQDGMPADEIRDATLMTGAAPRP